MWLFRTAMPPPSPPIPPTMPARWCFAATIWRPYPTIQTIWRRICKRWPDHPRDPAEAPFMSTDSAEGRFLPKIPSARFALTRTRLHPSMTGLVMAASKFSPSRAQIVTAARWTTITRTISGTPAILIRRRKLRSCSMKSRATRVDPSTSARPSPSTASGTWWTTAQSSTPSR